MTRTQQHVKRCPIATEPHDSRTSLTCRAPRRAPPHVYVGGARPGHPAPTAATSARHTARVPPAEDRRLEASALATVRVLLVRGCSRRTRSPRARGRGEDHSERPPGEARREAGRVALRPPCAPLWRALFDRAEESLRTGQCEERGLREAAEPTSLRHGKERGRGVCKQGDETRRCGVLEPRAEAPGRESTRRLS